MKLCTDCWLPKYDVQSEHISNPYFPWCDCPILKAEEPEEED